MHRLRNRYLLGVDATLLAATPFLVYALNLESWTWGSTQARALAVFTIAMVAARLVTYHQFGMYRRLWRYSSIGELELIVTASVAGSIISFVLGFWALPTLGVMPERIAPSALFTMSLLSVATLAGPRLLLRLGGWRNVHRSLEGTDPRVLIVGAGSAGQSVLRELRNNAGLHFVPIGFVDDDPAKQGMEAGHLPILGALADTKEIILCHRIERVIIAMPGAPGAVVRQVVRAALDAGAQTQTVPSLSEILSGTVQVGTLREVRIEDLLRREPIVTDMESVAQLARGRVVLVTGAGGSIGSELSRQIAALGPSKLVLLGHGENPIFEIMNELRREYPSVALAPVIADIRDLRRLSGVFETHHPFAVFHAAAHKHVPLMEENVVEAVTNNVLGTRNVVDACASARVRHLVCISTDKAVRPTNVMGATKRVAEHVVLRAAVEPSRNYVSVRFGNVLGSRGSVVPTFLRQIQQGGPVTVTHPEMRRYFMTIPEAVQLVLQAGALGRGGELFMLNMGEPVKVVDLARDMIRLSGLREGVDIDIEFTGARAGEKMYEEMMLDEESARRTTHPKVLRVRQEMIEPWGARLIDQLVQSALDGESEDNLRHMLQAIVPEFAASGQVPMLPTPGFGVRSQEMVAGR